MATFWSISMALAIPRSMSPAMLRRLHALAEQRCAYFIELHRSGRWRHYYTVEEMTAQMREAAQIVERFREMVIESDMPPDALAPEAEAGEVAPSETPNVIPLFARAS